jgi:hypothetical protein
METSASPFSSLVNIFFEPKKTLEDLRGHAGWVWLPLLLLIGLACLFQVWYALRVDVSWFADQTLAASAANMTADQLRDAHARFSTNSMVVFGLLGGSLGAIVWYVGQGLYFFLVAKLGGYKEQGFGSWFGFVVWTSLPALLAYLATGIYMLTTASRQISPVDIDVTSLNTLLFHIAYAHKGQFIASSLRLTTIWSWILMVIGFSAWTGKGMQRSTLVIMTPYVVLYAIFVLFAIL